VARSTAHASTGTMAGAPYGTSLVSVWVDTVSHVKAVLKGSREGRFL
jgi:hypothetical protein